MSNLGFREIRDTDVMGLKQLNDTLRTLWSKVMGGIEYRDLSGGARERIGEGVGSAALNQLSEQTQKNAQDIAQRATQAALDQLAERVRVAESAIESADGTVVLAAIELGGVNWVPDSRRIELDGSADGQAMLTLCGGLESGRKFTLSAGSVTRLSGEADGVSVALTGPDGAALGEVGVLSVSDGVQSLTFQVPELEGAAGLKLVRAQGSAFRLEKVKLERGGRASDYSPHPDDPALGVCVSGGGSRIAQGVNRLCESALEIYSGGTALDGRGLRAAHVSAPGIARAYAGGALIQVNPSAESAAGDVFLSLSDALDALSGRMLFEDVTVQIAQGAQLYGACALRGVSGGACVKISGGGARLFGGLVLEGCACAVRVESLNIYSAGTPLSAARCLLVEADGCVLCGANALGSAAVLLSGATRAYLTGCRTYYAPLGVDARAFCRCLAQDVAGTGGARALGGRIDFLNSRPTGALTQEQGGEIYAASAAADGGTPPAQLPGAVDALTLSPTDTGVLKNGAWTRGVLEQGYMQGEATGAVWFGGLSALLGGRALLSARLRLTRQAGYGMAGEAALYLCGGLGAYGSAAFSVTRQFGRLGALAMGQTRAFELSAAARAALSSGQIDALAFYAQGDAPAGGYSCSPNYCRLEVEALKVYCQ